MTKEEFLEEGSEQGFDLEFTDSEYKDIEMVYTFHPSLSEVNGKKQIAYLYGMFGMRIIKDMLPTAQTAKKYEEAIRAARTTFDNLRNEYKAFSKGEIDK